MDGMVTEFDLSNKKILIVDDNELNIKVATALLKKYNVQIDSALSGQECLEKVKTNTYDLIFMDDMMPGMNGIETFHRLKNQETFSTPVVVFTANAVEGEKEKYISEGFDAFFAKPINKFELERLLEQFLM